MTDRESSIVWPRNRTIRTVEDVRRLADHFSRCPGVSKFDVGEHNESWTLADSFGELENNMREFLDVELPKVMAATADQDEVCGALLEAGWVLERILYFALAQQNFYRYLLPDLGETPRPLEEADKA